MKRFILSIVALLGLAAFADASPIQDTFLEAAKGAARGRAKAVRRANPASRGRFFRQRRLGRGFSFGFNRGIGLGVLGLGLGYDSSYEQQEVVLESRTYAPPPQVTLRSYYAESCGVAAAVRGGCRTRGFR